MIVGIDIDDVVAKFVPYFLSQYNKINKTSFKAEDIKSYDMDIWLNVDNTKHNNLIFELQVNGKYSELEPYKEASKYINLLKKEGNKIIMLTSRICAKDTVDWLNKYDIPFDNLFTIKSKKFIVDALKLDYFIEDNPMNVFAANDHTKKIIFDQPWNQCIKNPNIKRVYNWKEIYDTIKKSNT